LFDGSATYEQASNEDTLHNRNVVLSTQNCDCQRASRLWRMSLDLLPLCEYDTRILYVGADWSLQDRLTAGSCVNNVTAGSVRHRQLYTTQRMRLVICISMKLLESTSSVAGERAPSFTVPLTMHTSTINR